MVRDLFEPSALQGARSILRGRGHSNIILLPDQLPFET